MRHNQEAKSMSSHVCVYSPSPFLRMRPTGIKSQQRTRCSFASSPEPHMYPCLPLLPPPPRLLAAACLFHSSCPTAGQLHVCAIRHSLFVASGCSIRHDKKMTAAQLSGGNGQLLLPLTTS